jgi:hypothetical protein
MTQDQPKQEPVTLTLEDLASVLSIVDVATARGAFKPKELVAVGTIYEKVSNFLEQVKVAPDAAPADDLETSNAGE